MEKSRTKTVLFPRPPPLLLPKQENPRLLHRPELFPSLLAYISALSRLVLLVFVLFLSLTTSFALYLVVVVVERASIFFVVNFVWGVFSPYFFWRLQVISLFLPQGCDQRHVHPLSLPCSAQSSNV